MFARNQNAMLAAALMLAAAGPLGEAAAKAGVAGISHGSAMGRIHLDTRLRIRGRAVEDAVRCKIRNQYVYATHCGY